MEAVDGTALAHLGDAGGVELLKRKAQAQQVLGGGIPALRGIAAFEGVDNFLGEAAVQEELASGGGLRGFQLLAVELVRGLVGGNEAAASTGLFIARSGGATLVVDVVTNFLGYGLNGLREGNLLHLHEEAEDIPALARGEAVIIAALRAHVEGRSLLILEGAQALQRVIASGFELNVLAHDFINRRAFTDSLDIAVRNSASCHAYRLPRPPELQVPTAGWISGAKSHIPRQPAVGIGKSPGPDFWFRPYTCNDGGHVPILPLQKIAAGHHRWRGSSPRRGLLRH